MIVNPYAEQESLADQIRNYSDEDFPDAMTTADGMIQTMLAGTTTTTQPAPPGWRHRLIHWLMQTFIVSRGIAEAAFGTALLFKPGNFAEDVVVTEGSPDIDFLAQDTTDVSRPETHGIVVPQLP